MNEFLKRNGQLRIDQIETKQLSTSELFQKHFGQTCAVDMKHPSIENFFEELNQICINEDNQKRNQ